jgi:hypothetical protein
MKEVDINMHLAVIVCEHVSNGNSQILRGVRDEPLDSEDSGWQFSCGRDIIESEDEASVWSIKEILDENPELISYINSPSGTIIFRELSSRIWNVR